MESFQCLISIGRFFFVGGLGGGGGVITRSNTYEGGEDESCINTAHMRGLLGDLIWASGAWLAGCAPAISPDQGHLFMARCQTMIPSFP